MTEETTPGSSAWPEESHADGVHGVGRRYHRVALSTIALIGSNTIIAALGALNLSVMTRQLGTGSFGVLVSVLSFISVTILFADLGVNTFTGREIARRRDNAKEILSQNLGLRVCMSVVMMPTIVGLSALVPNSQTTRIEGIAITALTIPCEALRSVSLAYYVATIQNYKSALINLLTQVLYVSGAVTAIHLGYGIIGCFWAYDVAMLVTAVIAFVSVRRNVHFMPRISWRAWGVIVKGSLGVGAIQVVNVLYLQMNKIMLTAMTTYHTVGEYGVATAIVTYLLVIPNAFMLSMLPLIVGAKAERLKTIVDSSATIMAIAGVLAVVGTVCVAPDLVPAITVAHYAGSVHILQILSLSVLFTCLTSVFTYSSFARDRHRRLLFISTSGLICNIGLNLVLIRTDGAAGAAISTVVVEGALLVGTFLMFRARVGPYFTAWTRVARILVAGGATYLLSHWILDATMRHGDLRLVVGMALVPTILLLGLFATRSVPSGVLALLKPGQDA